jgi:hypothetical protein
VASIGVHYLSVGALTHSSPALDLALDVGLPAGHGGRERCRAGGWPSSLPTRTVTSYLLSGSSVPGTVSVRYFRALI